MNIISKEEFRALINEQFDQEEQRGATGEVAQWLMFISASATFANRVRIGNRVVDSDVIQEVVPEFDYELAA